MSNAQVQFVERCFSLTGVNPAQQLSLRLIAARADHGGKTWFEDTGSDWINSAERRILNRRASNNDCLTLRDLREYGETTIIEHG